VIEEGLTGPELSVFALCDGTRAVLLGEARDHKRVGDGDQGPNTGGMGAFSPAEPPSVAEEAMDRFVEPTLAALRSQGIDYRGVLFAGLMLTPDGPKILEYNVRLGDPECQVLLPRLEGDVAELFAQAAAGALRDTPRLNADSVVTVVCASEGYPASPRVGDVIEGIDDARELEGVSVYCAGVGAGPDGSLVTAGGRVLNVCGRGPTLEIARERAYAGVGCISWPGMHHRRDIAAG
jgi:phosphoribosylamine--glycine ligase